MGLLSGCNVVGPDSITEQFIKWSPSALEYCDRMQNAYMRCQFIIMGRGGQSEPLLPIGTGILCPALTPTLDRGTSLRSMVYKSYKYLWLDQSKYRAEEKGQRHSAGFRVICLKY